MELNYFFKELLNRKSIIIMSAVTVLGPSGTHTVVLVLFMVQKIHSTLRH